MAQQLHHVINPDRHLGWLRSFWVRSSFTDAASDSLGRRPRARRRRRRGRSAARGGDPGGGAGSGAEQPQARSLLPHPLLGAPPQPPGAVLGPGDAPAFVKGERGARGSAEQRAAPAPAELLRKKEARVWPEQRRQGTRAASRPPRVFPCPAQQGQAAARGARL